MQRPSASLKRIFYIVRESFRPDAARECNVMVQIAADDHVSSSFNVLNWMLANQGYSASISLPTVNASCRDETRNDFSAVSGATEITCVSESKTCPVPG